MLNVLKIDLRIIVAQIVVIWQGEVLKLWQSSKNQIKWSAINLEGSPKRGNLINWRGTTKKYNEFIESC